jgi:hypothetical protein
MALTSQGVQGRPGTGCWMHLASTSFLYFPYVVSFRSKGLLALSLVPHSHSFLALLPSPLLQSSPLHLD